MKARSLMLGKLRVPRKATTEDRTIKRGRSEDAEKSKRKKCEI